MIRVLQLTSLDALDAEIDELIADAAQRAEANNRRTVQARDL